MDERDDEVYVRVLVCCCDDDEDDEGNWRDREYTDCPVRVWLKQPLGERAVIDVDGDEELPLYIPNYLDNVRPARPRISPRQPAASGASRWHDRRAALTCCPRLLGRLR